MNRKSFQSLRLKQLNEQLRPDQALQSVPCPTGGWLRAVRQALGLSLKSVAAELKISPQAIHQFEKSEAAGAISLRQLEAVAGAMGCRVIYALIPRHGTLADLANSADDRALRAAQHSMALEGQAIEHLEKPVDPSP
jgi:predicted DNA-binding mobile mystery protein A